MGSSGEVVSNKNCTEISCSIPLIYIVSYCIRRERVLNGFLVADRNGFYNLYEETAEALLYPLLYYTVFSGQPSSYSIVFSDHLPW